MKRLLLLTVLLSCFFISQPAFSQVFADFEEGTTQGFGKYWGDALTTFQWAADPTGKSAGVLELVCDATQGDHKAAIGTDPLDLKWKEGQKGAYFFSFDVYLPADFPTTPTVKVWSQVAEGSWQWMDYKYMAGGLAIKAGQWNTIHFPVTFANQQQANYDPKLHIKGGIEIYFPADVIWTGSVLVDNAALWGVEPKLVADFAKDTQGFGKYWGDALTTFQWAADPMEPTNGVLELVCDAAQGDHKAAIGTDPMDLGWTEFETGAGFVTFDVYLPTDFPTTPTIKVWSQVAEGSWQWMDYKYMAEGLAIKTGQWNTIHFPVVFANQQQSNYDPKLHIKGGIEIYFPADVTWTGSILLDNYQLHTLQVGKKWVMADFEKESQGTQNFENTGWAAGLTGLLWTADPSGQSAGVLKTSWDFALAQKGAFYRDPIDLQWKEEAGQIIVGATKVTFDVWVPPDMPDGAQFSIWAQDHQSWGWTEYKFMLYDTTFHKGDWTTLTYDVVDADTTYGDSFDPTKQVKIGFQIYYAVTNTWSGDVYFDNVTLWNVEKPVGALKSPQIVAAVLDTAAAGYVYGQVQWLDNEDNLNETYTVYASQSPITDVTAEGVIRIGTQIGRGVQYWNHRPYTSDGSEVTFYYAITATSLEGEETELQDVSTAGPLTIPSSATMKAVYDPSFNFMIDGTLSEFDIYADYSIPIEGVNGVMVGNWTPTSTDLNLTQLNLVIDDDYLYVGANVVDDELAESGQAWEGDALEMFIGFYNALKLAAWHDLGTVDIPGTGDYRISFTSWGEIQQAGSSVIEHPGMEYLILPSPVGYQIEAKINLDSMAAEGQYTPQLGDMLPFRVDVNDRDLLSDAPETSRTLQLNIGGAGNDQGWKRPSCWGYLEVYSPTAVEKENTFLPMATQLYNNYPNPFNPTTTLKYDLAKSGHVSLVIYNMLGQKIRTLIDANKAAGYHTIQWDGSNDAGVKVSSGIYLYTFKADGYNQTKKMILIK